MILAAHKGDLSEWLPLTGSVHKKLIFKARTIKHSIVSRAAGRVVIEMLILGNSGTILSLPLDVPTRMKHIFQPMSEPKDLANDRLLNVNSHLFLRRVHQTDQFPMTSLQSGSSQILY